ncbi:MAG: hypothetical protein HYU37_21035 [Acidobacteria bacterium]|nr:hypothetical protein [Acidobacteriota bacterium]
MAKWRTVPVILLVVALAGIVTFAQGFRLIDTIGLLVCGVVAGASLAALARRRH